MKLSRYLPLVLLMVACDFNLGPSTPEDHLRMCMLDFFRTTPSEQVIRATPTAWDLCRQLAGIGQPAAKAPAVVPAPATPPPAEAVKPAPK